MYQRQLTYKTICFKTVDVADTIATGYQLYSPFYDRACSDYQKGTKSTTCSYFSYDKGQIEMESHILIIVFLSFGLSFIFALGGVGSAIILIPTLS